MSIQKLPEFAKKLSTEHAQVQAISLFIEERSKVYNPPLAQKIYATMMQSVPHVILPHVLGFFLGDPVGEMADLPTKLHGTSLHAARSVPEPETLLAYLQPAFLVVYLYARAKDIGQGTCSRGLYFNPFFPELLAMLRTEASGPLYESFVNRLLHDGGVDLGTYPTCTTTVSAREKPDVQDGQAVNPRSFRFANFRACRLPLMGPKLHEKYRAAMDPDVPMPIPRPLLAVDMKMVLDGPAAYGTAHHAQRVPGAAIADVNAWYCVNATTGAIVLLSKRAIKQDETIKVLLHTTDVAAAHRALYAHCFLCGTATDVAKCAGGCDFSFCKKGCAGQAWPVVHSQFCDNGPDLGKEARDRKAVADAATVAKRECVATAVAAAQAAAADAAAKKQKMKT